MKELPIKIHHCSNCDETHMHEMQDNCMVKNLQKLNSANEHAALLEESSRLLKLDPNNSELLAYKFAALLGLGEVTKDIGFLRKYCWYRSLDFNGFFYLHLAYLEEGDKHNALIALAYCLSVKPDFNDANESLNEILTSFGASNLKISFLTVNRIGHLCLEPDAWLRAKSVDKIDGKEEVINLFVGGEKPANSFFLEMLCRYINIVQNDFWVKIFDSRPKLLSDDFYEAMPYDLKSYKRGRDGNNQKTALVRVQEIYSNSKPVLKLNSLEIERSWKYLETLGITKKDSIVCLHVRDSEYLNSTHPNIDLSYHDVRDCDIQTYRKSIEFLIDKGIHVVRIGRRSNQYLDIEHSRYFDLCINRNDKIGDLIEVFLLSICKFFIGMSSGPVSLAACFDTPILEVNVAPFEPFYGNNACFTPMHYVMPDGEIINFIDLISGVLITDSQGQKSELITKSVKELFNLGVRFKPMQEQELLDATQEFYADFNISSSAKNKSMLQQKYLQSVPQSSWFKQFESVVSNSFLDKYRENFGI